MSCPSLRAPLLFAGLAFLLLVAALAGTHRIARTGVLELERRGRDRALGKIRQETGRDPQRNFARILGNNLLAVAILVVAGTGTAGLYVLIYLGQFGVHLGLSIASLQASGVPGSLVVSLLVPHATLEIPALCLGAGVGLRAGWIFIRYLRGGGALLREGEVRAMLWTAAAALALMLPAAGIEAYLTPRIAARYLP